MKSWYHDGAPSWFPYGVAMVVLIPIDEFMNRGLQSPPSAMVMWPGCVQISMPFGILWISKNLSRPLAIGNSM